MTRADILPRVLPHLWSVSPREPRVIDEDARLDADLWLTGHGILKLGELLEEEFSTTIPVAALLNLALNLPTLGDVLDLIERRHV